MQGVTAAQGKIAEYAEEIAGQYRDITRELAEQRIMRDESLSDYEKEIALNDLAREAALAELRARFDGREAQREGLGLTEEETALREKLTREINKNYDAIASGIGTTEKEAASFKDITLQIAEASAGAFASRTSAAAEIAQMRAREAMEEIDRLLEYELESIEEARQAQLAAEGFIEAARAEDMQAQIDAAREANDEVLQYQLERRKRELEINEKYNAEAKAKEEQAARDKAEIEYEAAKTKYEMDITSAIVTGALAVGQAANNMWPLPAIPMMAAAATASSAQMAVILANPPKMPAFADGGIVPGQPHTGIDSVIAAVSPGELILNEAQQEALAPKIGGDLYIDLIYDGRKVSEMVVENYINKGRVLIDASRGIR
jgi:hypothetical protein